MHWQTDRAQGRMNPYMSSTATMDDPHWNEQTDPKPEEEGTEKKKISQKKQKVMARE